MTEKIKTLQIIHLGVCAGTIIAYFIIGDISLETLNIPSIDSNSILYLIIPVLAFVASSILFKAQLKQIDPKLKLKTNFQFTKRLLLCDGQFLKAQLF